jgi:predicted small metal-binding protein
MRAEEAMTYRVECDCGWATTGDEQEIVRDGQAHGREVHDFEPTAEQILAMARVTEPE